MIRTMDNKCIQDYKLKAYNWIEPNEALEIKSLIVSSNCI